MQAIWNGAILAQSDHAINRGSWFFPPDSVHGEYLRPSDDARGIPGFGIGSCCHVKVGEDTLLNAAWSIHEPPMDAWEIADWIMFRNGVEVVED